MPLIVQKYGGSSVADATGIRRVAQRIVDAKNGGNSVVAVVSAMGDTTDEYIDLAYEVNAAPPAREMDMLLSAGERISAALLAMAVTTLGAESRSYAGSQAGLVTDGTHRTAKVVSVRPDRIRAALDEGAVAIVAGFQGVSEDKKDITTLGRGASDITPVALAAAMNADYCEIYTDVDGVFSADPRIIPSARHIPVILHEEMLELAASGSKVLMARSVEYARRYGIPIHVRSSFSSREGTWVVGSSSPRWAAASKERPVIGVSQDRTQARVTIVGVPGTPGISSKIFGLMADAGISIDMLVQNKLTVNGSGAEISFTLNRDDSSVALTRLSESRDRLGFEALLQDDHIAKVSVVGSGMTSKAGVAASVFEALAAEGINISMISTSDMRISVVVEEADSVCAVKAMHSAFDLVDSDGAPAVVYGGSGR